MGLFVVAGDPHALELGAEPRIDIKATGILGDSRSLTGTHHDDDLQGAGLVWSSRSPSKLGCRAATPLLTPRTPSVCDASHVEQRISLVTLGVTDLSRARSFYEALGWNGAQQPDDEVCFFQAGGMVFGLWTRLGGHGAPGMELAYNVRSQQDVSAVLAEAERAGGTIVRPAARADWGGTSGAFADPEGYVWEVAHNPGWVLSEDGTVKI